MIFGRRGNHDVGIRAIWICGRGVKEDAGGSQIEETRLFSYNAILFCRRPQSPWRFDPGVVVLTASAQSRADPASLIVITSTPLQVRLNKPASTPPGPSSIKSSDPTSTSRSMQSTQRTVLVT
jgi:hypothetical protein